MNFFTVMVDFSFSLITLIITYLLNELINALIESLLLAPLLDPRGTPGGLLKIILQPLHHWLAGHLELLMGGGGGLLCSLIPSAPFLFH